MKLARPDRLVVATLGDGSYMFANPVACHQIMEAYDIPVLILILNNAEWGAVRQSVTMMYPEGYAATELPSKADNLQDDLLLITGSIDGTVLPEHSLRFIQACVNSGVQVDFFEYPGYEHNVRGKDRLHLMEKVLRYMDARLLH